MKKFVKILRYFAWFEIFSRTLFIRYKKGIRTPVKTPADKIFNQSIFNHILNFLFEMNYSVYVLYGKEMRKLSMRRWNDFNFMINDLLDKYFDEYEKAKARGECSDVSPGVIFKIYDYGFTRRKIAIIALDETEYICVNMNAKKYFNKYFGKPYKRKRGGII